MEGAMAFQTAARIVSERIAQRPVVVVSAMAGFTDALLGSVKEASKVGAADSLATLDKHFDRHLRVIESLLSRQAPRLRELVAQSRTDINELLKVVEAEGELSHGRRKAIEDAVVSNGERLSSALLAAVLLENNHSARDVDARRCLITDDNHGSAAPLMDQTIRNTCEQLQPLLDSATIPVLGGFIGSTVEGETTTLGRGGSDYSAAIFGAALECEEIQIWTDVPGV